MKGILFTPDNIKATVEELKHQTRRAGDILKGINQEPDKWRFDITFEHRGITLFTFLPTDGDVVKAKFIKPRYQVGEVVYIKEAWCLGDDLTGHEAIYYKLNAPQGEYVWNSPLFLPAKYARYFITIKDVRAERLQEITREDIRTEGIGLPPSPRFTPTSDSSELHQEYAALWDSINKPPYDWNSNPWVFVYTYSLNKGGN